MSIMKTKRAELLADIEAHTRAHLAELGIAAPIAEQAGCSLADHLAENWGGQVFSVPIDTAYKLSLREREILDLVAQGKRPSELARLYGMGERGMRKLLARAGRRNAVDHQLNLPLEEAECETA